MSFNDFACRKKKGEKYFVDWLKNSKFAPDFHKIVE